MPNWLTSIKALFGDTIALIPGSLWGVLIGAFVSIGTVMLTNRANERRLVARLNHERTQGIADREYAMRRDVYLAAAEAITACIGSIGSLSNLDAPHTDMTKLLNEKMPIVSKIQIVGGNDVVYKSMELAAELATVVQKLMVQRVPLAIKKQHIESLSGQMAQFGSARDSMVELMRSHNIEGSADPRRMGVLNGNFKFEAERFNRTLKERTSLQRSLILEQSAYARSCLQSLAGLQQLLGTISLEIRGELGIASDAEAYLALNRSIHEKLLAGVAESLNSLQALMPDSKEPTAVPNITQTDARA